MKITFTATSKARAEKFQQFLKKDRNLASTVAEKDGKFLVEYDIATISTAKKKKVAVKKGGKKSMPMDKKGMMDNEDPKKDTPEDDKDTAKCKSKAAVASADMGGMDMGPEDDCDYVEMDDLQEMFSSFAQYIFQEMQYQMNWMWSEIDYIENAFYQHVQNGHLPPINGADKMSNALKVLGIAGDYEVQKPVIYASTSNSKIPSLELDFPEPKKK